MKKYLFIVFILLISNLYSEICDLNDDGDLNIVDIVAMVNSILYDGDAFCDMNGDDAFNVLDIVALANCVLANN